VLSSNHLQGDQSTDAAAFPLTVFKPNKFPYTVPAGTNHYVWWTREAMFQTPDRVTRCIEAALQDLQVTFVEFTAFASSYKAHLRQRV
jgi:hypothetical protein